MEDGVDGLVMQNVYFSEEKNSSASPCLVGLGLCIAFQTLAGGAGAGAGAGAAGAPLRT